jgi:hypothetical protein
VSCVPGNPSCSLDLSTTPFFKENTPFSLRPAQPWPPFLPQLCLLRHLPTSSPAPAMASAVPSPPPSSFYSRSWLPLLPPPPSLQPHPLTRPPPPPAHPSTIAAAGLAQLQGNHHAIHFPFCYIAGNHQNKVHPFLVGF